MSMTLRIRMAYAVIGLVIVLILGAESSPLQHQVHGVRRTPGNNGQAAQGDLYLRQLMQLGNSHNSEVVKREGDECNLNRHIFDFYEAVERKVSSSSFTDENLILETCSRLVDNLVNQVEESLDARKDGNNCGCEFEAFQRAAKLLDDRQYWTYAHCTSNFHFQNSGGAESCTDETNRNCRNIYQRIRSIVNAQKKRKRRDLTPELQSLIDEAIACTTELQERPWSHECMKWKGFFSTPTDLKRAMWTLQAQGCGTEEYCGDPLYPYPTTCVLTEAEFKIPLDAYVNCVATNPSPQSQCDSTGQVEYGKLLSRFFEFTRHDMCGDPQLVEDIRTRAGCNTEPDNERRSAIEEEKKMKKKTHDVGGGPGRLGRFILEDYFEPS